MWAAVIGCAGIVFQASVCSTVVDSYDPNAPPGCNTGYVQDADGQCVLTVGGLAAQATAGLATSVANNFISTWINQWLGVTSFAI